VTRGRTPFEQIALLLQGGGALGLLRTRDDRPSSRRTRKAGGEIASPHGRCPQAKQHLSTASDDYGAVRNGKGLMSALGQKRTLRCLQPMSALPPKADIAGRRLDVRFVPKAEVTGAIRPPRRWQAVFNGTLRADVQC
jgi:hypothetical protein